MSALSDYKASVSQRGGYFFQALPPNIPLSRTITASDIGKVGARFPGYSADRQYRYEVAPATVQVEAGTISFLDSIVNKITDYAVDNPLGVPTFEEDIAWGEKFAADHKVTIPGPVDIVASAFGLNKYVFLGIAGLMVYAIARQAGIVPPLNKVIR